MRLKFNTFFVFLVVSVASVFAQKNTSSPYSRFGYGVMNDKSLSLGQALGGTGIGSNFHNHLNFNNPASFLAIDSGSFIMEIGVKSQFFNFSIKDEKAKASNSNMEYLAAGFPIAKWWKAGFSLMPFSRIGYSFKELVNVNGYQVSNAYMGSGGYSQVVLANAFSPFKGLSLGVNLAYVFGESVFVSYNEIPSQSRFVDYAHKEQWVNLKGMMYELGAQYDISLEKNKKVVLGVVFIPDQKLDYENRYLVSNMIIGTDGVQRLTDTVENYVSSQEQSDYPVRYGAGVSYQVRNKIAVAIDFSQQDWSNCNVLNKYGVYFKKQQSVHLGLQYTPSRYTSKGYYKRVSYRFGAKYENTYLNLAVRNNAVLFPVTEYSASFGMGLPLPHSENNVNLSVEMGYKTTSSAELIKEQFTKISINFTLHDKWFHKRKIN